jgi:uncharacterized DUF497 family protein
MTVGMEIEFDTAKDARNIAVHVVSLARAADLFQGPTIERVDDRRDYGEERIICFGYLDGRLHCCVYTVRGERRRIINLRKANAREQRKVRGAL